MDIYTNTNVHVRLEDFKKLENAANYNQEQIERLANKLAKDKIEKDAIGIRIHMINKDYQDEEAFIFVKCYDELNPKLEHLVQKIQYWAEDALYEQWGSKRTIQAQQRELEILNNKHIRVGFLMFPGWFIAIIAVVMALSK
jgi:hypothetical protein